MTKKRMIELAVKVVVAALTAFLTALTTTSCMGLGPVNLWFTVDYLCGSGKAERTVYRERGVAVI